MKTIEISESLGIGVYMMAGKGEGGALCLCGRDYLDVTGPNYAVYDTRCAVGVTKVYDGEKYLLCFYNHTSVLKIDDDTKSKLVSLGFRVPIDVVCAHPVSFPMCNDLKHDILTNIKSSTTTQAIVLAVNANR